MHVLILAAGFGTRLGEFGKHTPKGLIAHNDTTLLGKVLTDIQSLSSFAPSTETLALTTNARFFDAYDHFLSTHANLPIDILNNGRTEPDSRNGAIGDLLFSLDTKQWWDDDVLVVPSDTYYEFSLTSFVSFARGHDGFSTVVRDMGSVDQIRGRLGCAVMDGERIASFVEKPADPPSTFAAIPFYYYPKHVLAMMPAYKSQGGNLDAPGSIIPWLIAQGVGVYGYKTDGETLDVGTTEDVLRLSKL